MALRFVPFGLIVPALLVSSALVVQKSPAQLRDEDHPCGDPFTVSSYYFEFGGVVEAVNSCESVTVTITGFPYLDKRPKPKRKELRLAGIGIHPEDSTQGGSCRDRLKEILLSKEVRILLNGMIDESAASLQGILLVPAVDGSVNRELLKSGLARVELEEDYELNWWVECDYKLAEAHARENRLGVWVTAQ